MTGIINRTDLTFMLRDWLGIEELFETERYSEHTLETTEAILDIAEKLGTDLLAPVLRPADKEEPWLDEDGQVHVHPMMRDAMLTVAESGLFCSVFEEELGGMQLPFLVYVAAFGILSSANTSAAGFVMLSVANARVLANAAPGPLFEAFGAGEVEGTTFGTMCLSEPHAGSSLGDITTRAVPDGADELGERYRIRGSKMWISGADHDVTDNIVHLVLAKIANDEGTLPEGSRGISMFVVPKLLPSGERNDVVVAGLNHKLGQRGLPNAAFNLGEGFASPEGAEGAIGWIVGEPGQGLPLMFQMMNEARLSVGMAATMTAYRGYLMSHAYALERAQGRPVGVRDGKQVAIVHHPDVVRMLLAQKTICEGSLALVLYAARIQDEETVAADPEARELAANLLGLLTPIVKSWPSEFGQASLHYAIQILGGYGYTRDFEVELLYRDNRLNPIHEGTTGIQGLDLVNRKIRKDGGAAYRLLRERVDATIESASAHQQIASDGEALAAAWAEVDAAVEALLALPDDAAAAKHATVFLNAMGHATIGWIWLDMAARANALLDEAEGETARNHLTGKIKASRYFAQYDLPLVGSWLSPLKADAQVLADFSPEEFLGEVV